MIDWRIRVAAIASMLDDEGLVDEASMLDESLSAGTDQAIDALIDAVAADAQIDLSKNPDMNQITQELLKALTRS